MDSVLAQPLFAQTQPLAGWDPASRFVIETAHSFGYSFQQAANGLGQLCFLPEIKLLDEHQWRPGTTEWWGQQLGGGLATAAQFWALGRGVGWALGRHGAATLATTIMDSAITGGLYGGVFTPVAANDTRPWPLARLGNAASMATSLTVMNMCGYGVQSWGRSMQATHPNWSAVLNNRQLSGVLSGVPGGLTHTAMNGLTRWEMPTGSRWANDLANFTIVGGVLGGPRT